MQGVLTQKFLAEQIEPVMHPRSSVLRFVGRRACIGEPVGTGCFWQRGTIK